MASPLVLSRDGKTIVDSAKRSAQADVVVDVFVARLTKTTLEVEAVKHRLFRRDR